MRQTLVEFEGLGRSYPSGEGWVHALEGIDLRVGRGELMAITGASGSGKSTALNIMGTLDTPSRGQYRLDGMPVEGLEDGELALLRNRKIGFVFQDFRLLADKAYSHPSTRTFLRGRKIKHTIPEKSDQIARRKAKGSKGGRPPGFDSEIYKPRNTIERSFSRVKQWRGLATRYDKYAVTYLGGFLLGMVILTHRANH